MPLRNIEIICRPCRKCDVLKTKIQETIKRIEIQNKVKILCEIKITPDLRQLEKYSVSAAQAPAVLINGNMELAGNIETAALQKKLEELNRF